MFYAALLPRRGPHIASHSVCLSVCPSVPLADVFVYSSTVLRANIQNRKTSVFAYQRHACTFRHAQKAAYRTAISAAQILVIYGCTLHRHDSSSCIRTIIMRPSSLGGGRILRRTLSVCPSVPLPLPLVTSFRPR